MAAEDGAVYVLADINVAHTNPNDAYNSGSVELLRLTTAAWKPEPLSPGAPGLQLALTQVSGAILAAGSACPGLGGCTLEDGTAALLRLAAAAGLTPCPSRAPNGWSTMHHRGHSRTKTLDVADLWRLAPFHLRADPSLARYDRPPGGEWGRSAHIWCARQGRPAPAVKLRPGSRWVYCSATKADCEPKGQT